jgi:hypothetical protein
MFFRLTRMKGQVRLGEILCFATGNVNELRFQEGRQWAGYRYEPPAPIDSSALPEGAKKVRRHGLISGFARTSASESRDAVRQNRRVLTWSRHL